mmetsp:Transcript_29705/g.41698  ORF Transcript_29705/g.41698 Transcript_29705/m.41698 type:complete len:352 (-) Transcript_29705:85-1140(-)
MQVPFLPRSVPGDGVNLASAHSQIVVSGHTLEREDTEAIMDDIPVLSNSVALKIVSVVIVQVQVASVGFDGVDTMRSVSPNLRSASCGSNNQLLLSTASSRLNNAVVSVDSKVETPLLILQAESVVTVVNQEPLLPGSVPVDGVDFSSAHSQIVGGGGGLEGVNTETVMNDGPDILSREASQILISDVGQVLVAGVALDSVRTAQSVSPDVGGSSSGFNNKLLSSATRARFDNLVLSASLEHSDVSVPLVVVQAVDVARQALSDQGPLLPLLVVADGVDVISVGSEVVAGGLRLQVVDAEAFMSDGPDIELSDQTRDLLRSSVRQVSVQALRLDGVSAVKSLRVDLRSVSD